MGNGSGGPGYKYAGEISDTVKHDRPGLLSMANTGKPNTDGSQFFITFKPTPHLNGKHTIFGSVAEGMTTVRALEAQGTPGQGRTKERLVLERAEILVEALNPEMAAVDGVKEYITRQEIDTSSPSWRTSLSKPPPATFDPTKKYYWNLSTNKGDIKVQFLPDVAPMHVTSTIFLTELGFYDGLLFHRVIPGFMAQGGCPNGDGRGGPGYKYAGEISNTVKHDRPGLLSMANAGPGTDGSPVFPSPSPPRRGSMEITRSSVESSTARQP